MLCMLAAFYCEVQPDCLSQGSASADVTGALLVDAIVARRKAGAAVSAALGALIRDII